MPLLTATVFVFQQRFPVTPPKSCTRLTASHAMRHVKLAVDINAKKGSNGAPPARTTFNVLRVRQHALL